MKLNFLSIATAVVISAALVSCKCEKKNSTTATDTAAATATTAGATTSADAQSNVAGQQAGKLDASGNFVYDTGALMDITLPNGTKISQVGANSTENKLYTFLNDANSAVSDDKNQGWISLDRVYFDTGKSSLTPESQVQIKNITEILKAFPTANVKLGGYTDNTGSAATNVSVSKSRAAAVASLLTGAGVATANVSSEGYGPEHPICEANDTPECKAQNRRVDIRITKK